MIEDELEEFGGKCQDVELGLSVLYNFRSDHHDCSHSVKKCQ